MAPQLEKSSKNYIGYEYKEVIANGNKTSLYLDSYESFGWEIDEKLSLIKETGRSIIKLKRNRKIMNKTELTRLQRNFEDCMKQIDQLEQNKQSQATMVSIIIGIIGTSFIAGSVFAVTATPPMIWLCILLAIPGFIGWALPVPVFRYIVRKRTKALNPLIEEKYDEIDNICEKGNHLLGNMDRENGE